MIPTADDCDECRPAYLLRDLDSFPPSTIALSSVPFVLTFLVVAIAVSRRILPLLSPPSPHKSQEYELPECNKAALQESNHRIWKRVTMQRIAATACATTMALSSVLVELILCEISNSLNPAARGLALRITLFSLLLLIVILIPALEVHSVVSSWFRSSSGHLRKPMSWFGLGFLTKVALLTGWLVMFWYLPHTSMLSTSLHGDAERDNGDHGFVEACLERIGIIGTSLMASLAGFAAVSSVWRTFGLRHRVVRETDIARKESGLLATRDMLATKQSRLRALQRKISIAEPEGGLLTRIVGSIRGNNDTNELKTLEMEVSGLEAMSNAIERSVSTLRTRFAVQQRALSFGGRLVNAASFGFALYCLYRIAATSLSSLRRWWQPNSTFATSDPINNILALVTAHYDPSLDQAAWARQISFALSGVMLLLSFSAVLQTFLLFSRFAPALVQHARTSLPLLISQIAGTYVISSALLLRSNLPTEVSSVITEALGSPLDGRFVEGWFESWFLLAVGMTAIGIIISKKAGNGDGDDWDDPVDLESGKMS